MNYEQAKPLIRSGDLLAFAHGDWESIGGIKTQVVRMATRSTYSHVGMAWVPYAGGPVLVLEAVKPELRIYPLALSGSFYFASMEAKWTRQVEDWALSKIGVDYSEWHAELAFFRELEEDDVSECAAYVREIYEEMGINLGARSTPDAVVLEAQKRPGVELIYVENGEAL